MYFLNYSNIYNDRTTECELFYKLKDALKESEGKFGYIIRQQNEKNKMVKFFGGFKPSAGEQLRIEGILKINK